MDGTIYFIGAVRDPELLTLKGRQIAIVRGMPRRHYVLWLSRAVACSA